MIKIKMKCVRTLPDACPFSPVTHACPSPGRACRSRTPVQRRTCTSTHLCVPCDVVSIAANDVHDAEDIGVLAFHRTDKAVVRRQSGIVSVVGPCCPTPPANAPNLPPARRHRAGIMINQHQAVASRERTSQTFLALPFPTSSPILG